MLVPLNIQNVSVVSVGQRLADDIWRAITISLEMERLPTSLEVEPQASEKTQQTPKEDAHEPLDEISFMFMIIFTIMAMITVSHDIKPTLTFLP